MKVGDRVQIFRRDIKRLRHRIKKGPVFGVVTNVDDLTAMVRPMWCDWHIELYKNEVRIVEEAKGV